MKFGKLVKFILQIAGLILLNKIGFLFVDFFDLLIPGNVVGMVLLFLLLWSRLVRLEWIEDASDFLVKHLSFFFVSISVGLMTLGGLLAKNGLQLAIILVFSAIIGMAFAGFASHVLIQRKGGAKAGNPDHDF
ncbi:CidA/LrgA family protein [Mesobacillus subterraneus]|uniref:Murein hydrolase regulator LrgA n=1 Tax=Mesobacillus subterraneus TaxID=285983 RepID=A0A3R9FVM9_9BACI|nr:CidA/LrgA family protein [Mesobacillus subterraneus]RSD26167.1 murein hydrolase regulator LrgA [Mesobacillus subterraneus]